MAKLTKRLGKICKVWVDLITKPDKQVLLPVIFYIDAANTGHFADNHGGTDQENDVHSDESSSDVSV